MINTIVQILTRFDQWTGSLAIVAGTLMLLLGLELGGVTRPWDSATVICLIVFGVVVAGLFILNEWKFARYPVMPMRIFNNSSNLAALGVCFCHGFCFISGTYYLPLYFQAVLGATPLLSGVYLMPFALALSFVSAAVGVFIKKTGKYLPPIWYVGSAGAHPFFAYISMFEILTFTPTHSCLRFGLVVMTLGFGLFIDLERKPNWAKIIIYQIVAGIGVGPNFQAPLIALQSNIGPKDIAAATATFGFVRNLSTAISVVIGSVVFQNQMQKKTPSLVNSLGPELAAKLSGGSAGANVGIVEQLPPAQRIIAQAAFYESLRTMWIMYVAFAAFGILVSFFIGANILSKDHQVTKTGIAEEELKRKELQQEKKRSKQQLQDEKRASKEAQRVNATENRREAGDEIPVQEA